LLMGEIRCLPFACTLVTKPLPSSLLMRRQASLLLMSSFRCDDVDHDTGTLGILDKNQASGGVLRDGERPNVASGSLVSSMAFCFAFDDGPLTWPHAREACPACPETPFTPLCPAWMNPCRLLRREQIRSLEVTASTALSAMSAVVPGIECPFSKSKTTLLPRPAPVSSFTPGISVFLRFVSCD